MRRLVLLRHANTVASVAAGDHARPLNRRGMREATTAGLWLAERVSPDFACVSDARRTRETFDRVIESFGREIAHGFDPRLYGASADEILSVVRETAAAVETLLVVGHNPGLGDLARRLARKGETGGRRDLEAHFPTAAFAIIGLDASDWSGADRGGTLQDFTVPLGE